MRSKIDTLRFITLKIEGFGSIVDLFTFKLEEPGLNIIRGENGVGKTTIFSALSWVLYDKILKKGGTIETWEHMRPKLWNGTMVSISFYKDGIKYKVTRCREYKKKIGDLKGGNRLIIEEEGTVVSHLKDKRDLQKYLEAILGMSFSLFSNVILFAQKGTRFIEETGPNKKAILEESFKINWITRAQDVAKELRKEANIRWDKLETQYTHIQNSIHSLQEVKAEIDIAREDFHLKKAKAIRELEERISILSNIINQETIDLAPLKEALSKNPFDFSQKDSITKSIQQCKDKLSRGRNDSRSIGNQIEDLDNKIRAMLAYVPDNKICPECGSVLTQDHSKELVEKWNSQMSLCLTEKAEKDQEILGLEEFLAEHNKNLDKILRVEADYKDLSSQITQAYAHNSRLESQQAERDSLKGQLKEKENSYFQDNSPKIDTSLYQLNIQLNQLKPERAILKRRVKLLSWAIEDPLSNSGIKSFLFDKLLARLNLRLKYYQRFTGFGIYLEIDMTTGRKDINAIVIRNEAPIDYRDLSGGESRMIDLMIALGCGDVLLMDNPMNIRVYDEPLESLDPSNTEVVVNLLRAIGETHSVFFITHNPAFHVSGANTIHLKKLVNG